MARAINTGKSPSRKGIVRRRKKVIVRPALATGAGQEPKDMSKVYARELLRPFGPAAISIADQSGDMVGLDSPTLLVALEGEADAVHKGDMRRVEAMLVVQAHTLDAIFNRMLRNMKHNQFELHMRMAFRAQAQCARTIEVLSAVKYPQSPQFIRQQNVAGVQQVNNGAAPAAARAGEEKLIPPNKLLEANHGQRLDAGQASAAVSADSQVAAVEEVHGSANDARKGARVEERIQGRQARGVASSGAGDARAAARPRSHRARSRVGKELRGVHE